MDDPKRRIARSLAQQSMSRGDPLGWFEELYSRASADTSIVPWADKSVNPNLLEWLDKHPIATPGRALKVGCGLGHDAEELARCGFETTAFDISCSAISICKRRFPNSRVNYMVVDLFKAPLEWTGAFDFVLESYTLQVLPPGLRTDAINRIVSFLRPGGRLLVIARGRESHESPGDMPWPLTREEMDLFRTKGLEEISFEDFLDLEEPRVRRFRALYLA